MEINEYLIQVIEIARDLENIEFFCDEKLSKTEFRLLREVILEGEKGKKIISSELARRLGVTRSAISQIVTKLEEQNIVQRVDSPTDRKIAYVQLTDEAYSLFETHCKEANAMMEKVCAHLGEKKLSNILSGYEQLVAAFKKVATESKQK